MRKIWTKAAVVTVTGGALVLGGAGMASADTGGHSERSTDKTDTRVDDVSDVSLDDLLDGTVDVDDLVSGNNVLNGVDVDVADILNGVLSGNESSSDVDSDTSSSQDGDGLLGGLLN